MGEAGSRTHGTDETPPIPRPGPDAATAIPQPSRAVSPRWRVCGVALALGCASTAAGVGRPDGALLPDAAVDATRRTDRGELDERQPEIAVSGCIDAGLLDARPSVACTAIPGDRSTALHHLGVAGNLTSLVWNGVDYAFTWAALESSSPVLFGLYFGRADRGGALVPGSTHRILPTGRYATRGALAVSGGGYGFAFITLPPDGLTVGMRAHFARLDGAGVLIPGSERALSAQHTPHLAITIAYSAPRREWAVAWQGQDALVRGGVEHHAYLTRISASCGILRPDATLLDGLRSTTDPYLAPNLVWARDRYAIGLTEYVDIPNARVAIAEIDPTTAAVTRRIILHEGGRPLRVSLATDGTMYGAAWMQLGLDTPSANAVWFRRATVGGDALGNSVVLGNGRDSGEPDVLFDGDTFRVGFAHLDESVSSVWWARFSRDGAVVGVPGRRFVGTTPFSPFPLLASDGCNDAVGWTEITGTLGQSATVRLHLRATGAD